MTEIYLIFVTHANNGRGISDRLDEWVGGWAQASRESLNSSRIIQHSDNVQTERTSAHTLTHIYRRKCMCAHIPSHN